MTDPATEAAFQAALDAQPDDHVTRLVFADYLEECGDVRAEGYRALATLRLVPDIRDEFACYWKFHGGDADCLPEDWFRGIAPHPKNPSPDSYMRSRLARAQAEDAAARAFALLPPARRAELLARPALA